MFSVDSPTAVRGVDKPCGCLLARLSAAQSIIDAIIKLRKKISNESMQERDQIKQTHRYYSTTHNMKVVDPILTGKYLQSQTHKHRPRN